ncbi:MAG: 2-amino-4-hydroxy-6-hydroxymethyldihydropteridine diphosphokinase [Muribaculaceae bacterium]|nr:2-amino-4-hydroxy-6-hydroxymethyldihydropteridine diphosphokinase [Muribaculaceae bacterium]MDE7096760.1 2-amino-4-hydroxy-6-hydroxymethyldihydropteridine diphosphokinase [Muribaculaceae bacterium]
MTPTVSVEAVFSVGSNCGDRVDHVEKGLKWLSSVLFDCRCSHIYATPDCHGSCCEYMNAVVKGSTSLTPRELENMCKEYEISMGRDDSARKAGNVPVDIDLVVYDNRILRKKDFSSEFFIIGYSCI